MTFKFRTVLFHRPLANHFSRIADWKRRSLGIEQLCIRAMLTTYFIDGSKGDDHADGLTRETAWHSTINIASRTEGSDVAPRSTLLQAGDVIRFIGGDSTQPNYNAGKGFGRQFLFLRDVHGTPERPIRIESDQQTWLSPISSNGQEMSVVYVLQSSNLILDGLQIADSFGSAINIAASDKITVRNCQIRDIHGLAENNLSGVLVVASGKVTIENNYIHNVYDRLKPGNPNNRPIVIFGSTDVRVQHNTMGYDHIGLGYGIEYKHLGSLSPQQTAEMNFEVAGNVIRNTTHFGITSAAPNSHIHHNLLHDAGGIRAADIGGTSQISNHHIHHNTILNMQTNGGTGSLYYVPSEYPNYPIGPVSFLNNLIVDNRDYYHSETNTLEVERYGSDLNYLKSIGAGLLKVDYNLYSTSVEPRFDLMGGGRSTLGSVYGYSGWQHLGFDRQSTNRSVVLDDYFSIPESAQDVGWYHGSDYGLVILPLENTFDNSGRQVVRATRRGDLALPLTVSLISSAPVAMSIPSTVVIPAEKSFVEFQVQQSVPGNGLVQIRARAAGQNEVATWIKLKADFSSPDADARGVFQIPGVANGSISVRATIQGQFGEYRSEMGWAYVDDSSGRVNGISPNQAGWVQQLLSRNKHFTLMKSGAETGDSTIAELVAGRYVVFYLVQDSSLARWQLENSGNRIGSAPLLFTSVADGNPDDFNHLRSSSYGDKLNLAWEDLTFGGDQNFTDLVVELDFLKNTTTDYVVKYSLQFTDTHGRIVDNVHVGDDFYIDVVATDLRANAEGVFSVALDLEFDSALATVSSGIDYGPQLPNLRGASVGPGRVSNLRAAASVDSRFPAPLVARIPIRAKAAGILTVSSDASDFSGAETTLIGQDAVIPNKLIEYGRNQLTINSSNRWHNTRLNQDTNGDGQVTPIDALLAVNHLIAHGETKLNFPSAVDHLFNGWMLDVNNDGKISTQDVQNVLQELDRLSRSAL